jgi:hypothetical protein
MDMVTEYPPIRIVSPVGIRPGNGTDARLRAPGRGRTAARNPIGVVGRFVRGQTGSSNGHPSSWRAADDSLCLVGHLRSPLGREGRIRCARESRRFHPCACLPTAHGDQSVGFGAFSLGGREEHLNADRGKPSGSYVAIGKTCPRGRDRGKRGGPSHNQRASWRQTDHNLVF